MEPRTVLVTGAARRIGRAIALHLARQGFRVAIHYNTSQAEARAVAEDCGGAELFQANLESVASIEAMFAELNRRLGGLYALVNNAARFTRVDPLEITERDWDFIHSVNLKAVFFCCQQAARLMFRSGAGRIVNISSLGGIRPWAAHAHYCASKAGVIHLTRALAKAWAPTITVNSVAPGVIPFGPLDEESEAMVRLTPAGKPGAAEDIASAVSYFLNATDYVTGQVLAIDGGLSQR
jgi:NAD(P)-dependent dehydrogenase (short-subunit alcohol dehydrogenase family)